MDSKPSEILGALKQLLGDLKKKWKEELREDGVSSEDEPAALQAKEKDFLHHPKEAGRVMDVI